MTTVIRGTDDSASTPALTGTDADTGVFFPAANTMAMSTGGSERMRIDSSGNVGIGTTSPGVKFDVSEGSIRTTISSKTAAFDAAGGSIYTELNDGTKTWRVGAGIQTAGMFTIRNNTDSLSAVNIDSSGNLLVGTTSGSEKLKVVGTAANFSSPSGSCVVTIAAENASGANADLVLLAPGSNSSTIRYDRNNGQLRISVGSTANGVSLANGGTSWGSFSDERLKDIIEPIENASEKVSSLRAVIGRYKTDEPEKRRAFLIAQDVRAVLPEAVYQNNEEDDTLNLAYTDTIPLLVAAIQELKAINDAQASRIETLEAKVAALEAR